MHSKQADKRRTAHGTPSARCSSASSTANGSRVSPSLLNAIIVLAQSASSRSAGWTCVPSCVERDRNRAAAEPPQTHTFARVR